MLEHLRLESTYFLTVQMPLFVNELFKISCTGFCLLHTDVCSIAIRFRCEKLVFRSNVLNRHHNAKVTK